MQIQSYLIAVDWGTSHLRAYLCKINPDKTLTVIDHALSLGVNKVETNFEDTLLKCIAPWTKNMGKLPVFMTGQIGSSIGWKETAYIPCPTLPNAIASSCVSFECSGHKMFIVPGLSCQLSNDNYDVMRGEELQVLGWLQLCPSHRQGAHLICLPGTHTKWVLVNEGKIELFKTAMTGELYDLLSNHSILIQEKCSDLDEHSFTKGANFTLNSELGSFTHGLFSVRSKQLFGELSSSQANSYLSGLLIGSDVRAAVNADEWAISTFPTVSIIGNKQLSSLFSQVLNTHGVSTRAFNVNEITLLGFISVYQQMLTMP